MTRAPVPIDVTLLQHEMLMASLVACMRQTENLTNGLRDAHGAEADDPTGWGYHILGGSGEMAFAKHINAYWNGSLGDLKAADVGGFQVRTRSKHTWDLIVHKKDEDDDVFVLVTGMPPNFRIQGWIMGSAAKQARYWKDPAKGHWKDRNKSRPAYFVPRGDLSDMALLPKIKSRN